MRPVLDFLADLVKRLHRPLAVEAGETGLAGEELLHGGLLDVALLGDEPVQLAQQSIHIAQRLRNGTLFGLGRNRVMEIDGVADVELLLRRAVLNVLNLLSSMLRVHHPAQPTRVERWMLPNNHH